MKLVPIILTEMHAAKSNNSNTLCCVSKTRHSTFGRIFSKCRLILKIYSLADSKQNCLCLW